MVDVRPRVQFNIVNTNSSPKIHNKLKAINIEFGTIERYLRGVDVEESSDIK